MAVHPAETGSTCRLKRSNLFLVSYVPRCKTPRQILNHIKGSFTTFSDTNPGFGTLSANPCEIDTARTFSINPNRHSISRPV